MTVWTIVETMAGHDLHHLAGLEKLEKSSELRPAACCLCSSLLEGGFAFGDGAVVAVGIDPDRVALLRHARELREHVEVHAVCAEEDVAGQRVEHDEGVGEVAGDAGIGCGIAGE